MSAAPVQASDIELTTLGFSECILNLPLYDWQARALLPLEYATGPNARLQNITVAAPNGAGKDDRIIAAASYWWLFYHPRGKVAITSKSDLQLTTQTIPSLDKHWPKFGWKEPVKSPRYELRTPTGGRLTAFVSNSGERVEGWHKDDDIDGPLLQIVNEAKSVDEEIFQGLDRWTVNARLWVSSPGLMMGRFYDTFTKHRAEWTTIQAGLTDCPHIEKERIEYTIKTYGEKHPITRSTLYGEFMEQDEASTFCVPLSSLVSCLESPPRHMPGFRYAFCDFADGGAENVLVLREGNRYTIEDAWRETNEDAVVGKFIYHFRRLNLSPDEIGGDAAGKAILDKLAQAGWPIARQNFGAPDKSGTYKSWSALAWIEGGNKIKNREVILPDDEALKAQLTTRKKLFTLSGKQAVEDKYVMAKERGLPSPDRADALFGAMAAVDLNLMYPKPPFTVTGWRDEIGGHEDAEFMELVGASAGL
jgi:hypothetical protein